MRPRSERLAKRDLLRALESKLIISTACREIRIKRQKVEQWRKTDPVFREALETLELEILDKVKTLALQKMGILPSIDDSHKSINDSLIMAYMKREPLVVNVSNAPTPLSINGLGADLLKNLAKPEAAENREEEQAPSVELQGVPLPKTERKKPEPEAMAPGTEMVQ